MRISDTISHILCTHFEQIFCSKLAAILSSALSFAVIALSPALDTNCAGTYYENIPWSTVQGLLFALAPRGTHVRIVADKMVHK
jgi:hypothetical protein